MSPLPEQPSPTPRGHRRLAAGIALVALLVAAAWLVVTAGNPLPPRTVVMTTGPEGSAQAEFGERYRDIFRAAGVDLQLRPSAGGLENVERLRDPASEVSAGFVESGLASRGDSPDLASLGAVGLEALWMFFRDSSRTLAEQLKGKRVSIDAEGSGTRVLVRRLLQVNQVDEASLTLLALPPEQGADALIRGEVDAAMMLTSWRAPAVQRLLATRGIVLQGFPRADAYVALYPVLNKVVLPMGVADFARNVPSADLPLLAVESHLVIRRTLHPALKFLLLEAAAEIHGGADVFHGAGRYPVPGAIDLPLSTEAQTFYRTGRPFFYRNLPYWLAALAERLVIVLLPLLAILLPIANVLPRIYAYLTERRIFSLYRDLRRVEELLEAPGPLKSPGMLVATLDELDHRASHLKVPITYTQRLFIVKSHIALAREQVERRRHAPPLHEDVASRT